MDYSTDGIGFGGGLDWDMTSNQGLTPLVNYNFNLQVEGVYNLPCKSVRVFQRENEYETLQEGGLNDYVHLLRKPISKPMTFQVERYVGIDMFDPLALGTDLTLPVILMVSRYQGEGGNGVLDLSDSMQRMYTFTGCTVMSKEYGELNAERSGLLVETTTIAYREMLCVDNPSTKSKRKTWSMKKDYKNMQRDAERKEAKALLGITELTKAEMEEKAKMYEDKKVKEVPMHVLNYKGTKVSSKRNAHTHENEIGIATKKTMASKSEREKAAVRYFIPGSVSKAEYKGSVKQSATVNKDELRKKAMEEKAKKGGAVTKTMTPRIEREQQAKRYFLPGSQSVAQYMGTTGNSATLNDSEVRKADMPNRKGGANIPEMKPTQAREGGANIPEMKPTQAREGGANIPKMEKTKGQRRYFIAGSMSRSSYSGTVRASATVHKDEVRKPQMQSMARKWPQTRSAADVAAFLKKK